MALDLPGSECAGAPETSGSGASFALTITSPKPPKHPQHPPGQAGLFGDLSNAHGLLSQHGVHLDELFARVARFAAEVGVVALC
jgi:hypothetical protein